MTKDRRTTTSRWMEGYVFGRWHWFDIAHAVGAVIGGLLLLGFLLAAAFALSGGEVAA